MISRLSNACQLLHFRVRQEIIQLLNVDSHLGFGRHCSLGLKFAHASFKLLDGNLHSRSLKCAYALICFDNHIHS
jgi:hypothetical protein